MSLLDSTIGVLLIASWINYALLSSVLHGSWTYFRSYPKDHWLLKTLVGICIINDVASTCFSSSAVYNYLIHNFGNMSVIGALGWQWSAQAVTIGISSSTCQSFLIWRLYKLVPRWFIIGPLALLTLTCVIVTWYGAYLFSVYPSLEQRSYFGLLITLWGAAEAGADLAINGVLFAYLLMQGRRSDFANTKRLVQRLAYLAAQSGAAPTICALTLLIVFRAIQSSNASGAIGNCIGRVYTLTLLANLNARRRSQRLNNPAFTGAGTWTANGGSSRDDNVHFSISLQRRSGFETVTLHDEGRTLNSGKAIPALHDRASYDKQISPIFEHGVTSSKLENPRPTIESWPYQKRPACMLRSQNLECGLANVMSNDRVAASNTEVTPVLSVLEDTSEVKQWRHIWFNIGLYTYVLTEAWFYHVTFPKDAWALRVIVAIMLINDSIATAINCSMVYGYTVVGFNNPAGILHLGWEWVGLATCIAISSSICQSFLVWRLSKLVRVWWMLAPLVALILTCFIVTLYGGYQLSVYQTLDQRTYLGLLITLWGAAEAAADVVINGVLVVYLLAQGRKSEFTTTKRTVKRLALLALQSGALPSLCALLVLILFRAVQSSNVSGLFAMVIGRVYTVTLLSNLNARNHGDRNSRHAATSNNTRSAIHISQSVHFASSRPRKGGLDDIDLEGSHESMVMAPRPRPKSSASDSTIPEVAQTPLPTVVVQSATDASLDEREQPASPASKVCHLPNDLTDIETDRQEAQW